MIIYDKSVYAQVIWEEDSSLLREKNVIQTLILSQSDLQKKEQQIKRKKKKQKRKVHFDIETKKIILRHIKGRHIIHQIFYILKTYQKPNPYLERVFFYDQTKRKIMSAQKYKPIYGMPLHGPYKKTANGEIIELGSYYIGGKTSRWEKYTENGALLNKEKYYRGFPKESHITYWDREQTKIKEVIPIHYGTKEGTYLAFYESGNLKEKGIYKNGTKIKAWWKYYDKRDRRNHEQEIVYPSDPYDTKSPYIRREWNKDGKKLIDIRKGSKISERN